MQPVCIAMLLSAVCSCVYHVYCVWMSAV